MVVRKNNKDEFVTEQSANGVVSLQRQEVDVAMLDEWTDFLRKYQHDLQGPLRNIANFLQILKEELSSPGAIDKKATLKCISAAEHCVYTLNSINISQLIDNNNDIKVFDLENLLDPLYCLLLSQLNERRCRIDVEPNIPHIIGNKDEILRVFKNLIENSLNHAKTKQDLVIKITKLCQRGDRVMLQFSDNGKTLSNRDRDKIRKSFKLPASGISIVNSLLRKNNGYLQFVKSDTGCLWELELHADVSQKQEQEIPAAKKRALMSSKQIKFSNVLKQKQTSKALQKVFNKSRSNTSNVIKMLQKDK